MFLGLNEMLHVNRNNNSTAYQKSPRNIFASVWLVFQGRF